MNKKERLKILEKNEKIAKQLHEEMKHQKETLEHWYLFYSGHHGKQASMVLNKRNKMLKQFKDDPMEVEQ